ncbi:MAG: HepT-like ribonuclease domain-containing protein [Terriglobia bacterium]
MTGAKWKDQYPTTQAWADDFEQLLAFAEHQRVLNQYIPRLQASNRQRNAALAELRVAWFFNLNGYRPQRDTWKPNGGADADGEFEIQGPSSSRELIEVKHRDWQGELTGDEIQAGAARLSKYQAKDGGSVAPWQAIQDAIQRAYAKFDDQTPSLLVVGNGLFVGLWKRVAGLRNILAHTHFDADPEIVWRIVQDDLPTLNAEIEKLRWQSNRFSNRIAQVDQIVASSAASNAARRGSSRMSTCSWRA